MGFDVVLVVSFPVVLDNFVVAVVLALKWVGTILESEAGASGPSAANREPMTMTANRTRVRFLNMVVFLDGWDIT